MIYIVLFLISFSLTYLIKEYAIKKSLVATINERSSHIVPTPHGGGIAVSLTWFLGLIYLYKPSDRIHTIYVSDFSISDKTKSYLVNNIRY